ncbi:MAG TPA: cytochrome P450 [Burkholderiales bacterium]|nr:cytochrome P450 [Burkholderiales bacterium]
MKNPSLAASPTTRRIRDLPAPPGLPLIGNLLQLDVERLHLTAEGWRRKYGDFYRFRNARREVLVISDAEAIGTILRDRPEGFQRTQRMSRIANGMGFNGVFTANGDRWRRQRPMVMAGLDPAHVKTYFPALVKVTQRFAGRWQRAAAAGTAIDLQADLMRYTVDVTAGLAFGADINTIESDTEVIQTHLDKVLPSLFRRLMAPFDYWRYFKLPADRALVHHLEELHRAVNGFITAARKRMDAEPERRANPSNLIEAMIAARDTEGSGVDDADVAGNVLTMLLAGEDTTANTLAWMIWLLSRNPPALERARKEVLAALGGQPLPMQYEQLAAMPFVEACANETMRLKPVAPLLIVETIRDTVVAGLEIPAGQIVMCLMRPPAVDERHFPDPQTFDPARWLDKSAASAKRVAMPFGAGPRLCPGRYLAMLEMKMAIAMLLAGFDLESVGTADGGEPRELMAFTMAPVGLRMKLRSRA